MNDFKRHVAGMRGELQSAIDRVLDSGWFILGKEVEAFERELAAFLAPGVHAVGVGNGLDAIQLALMAFDVGPGDEVITTPNSAFATTLAVLRVGAIPVFVDLDPRSCALDVSRVEAAITPRTRALLPVHIYGRAAELEPLAELAQERGLTLVNDAAQAHGARHRGRDISEWGDVTAYSFYPTKNLGCFGDGGAVVTADAARASRLRTLRDYGQDSRYHHVEAGLNSRLDELQAAILRVKLHHLAAHNARRRAIAAQYDAGLKGLPLELPPPADGEAVHHLYVIRTPLRDQLMQHLRERQIQTAIHYPTILPLQPALAPFGFRAGQFPVAEKCAAELLSLPISPELSDEELARTLEAVRGFFV